MFKNKDPTVDCLAEFMEVGHVSAKLNILAAILAPPLKFFTFLFAIV